MVKISLLILFEFVILITGCFISGSELYSRNSYSPKTIKPYWHKPEQNEEIELIRPDKSNSYFVGDKSGRRFIVWGLNYDHNSSGRLIEDYWQTDWDKVKKDFMEMKDMRANLVRIHLQLPKFMKSAESVDEKMLLKLKQLINLAEKTGLYLDITGLGCYHKMDVPKWYDDLNEADRWSVQSLFWKAVAKTCESSPAIFCFDLMNEPIVAGDNKKETEWLAGEFGGEYFTQRITLDLSGRTSIQVAKAWVEKLVNGIRLYDKKHMITVGVIPWAYYFPGAKPLFYSDEVGKNLDFVSVHFYPQKDDTQNALQALKVYNVGKPIVVEEMFPLQCTTEELDSFIEGSRNFADGWVGFYWGKSLEDYKNQIHTTISEEIIKGWLKYFQNKAGNINKSKD
jgi:hypothetical protein